MPTTKPVLKEKVVPTYRCVGCGAIFIDPARTKADRAKIGRELCCEVEEFEPAPRSKWRREVANRGLAKIIRGILEDIGPMTAYEMSVYLKDHPDVPPRTSRAEINDKLNDLTKRYHPLNTAHILTWQRIVEGQRYYPRPVFAAGPGVNAKKPRRLSQSERNKRAWRKKVACKRVAAAVPNSIFNLGDMLNAR